MQKTHWIGAGLSSGPGIRRLAKLGQNLTLWNRTISKAQNVFDGRPPQNVTISEFTFEKLTQKIHAGDIVVSMLPANFHPQVAKICLEAKAHLVTTSYVSNEMKEFHKAAKEAHLCFVNEAGLDPGLDHLFARELFWRFQESKQYDPDAHLSFLSYCGGFPEHPGKFCYKFSWSPVGVLRALKSPVKYLRNGCPKENPRPWQELAPFDFFGETFEVYPNRDSLSYIKEYGFHDFQIDDFMRGTLRPKGWSLAWQEIFKLIETANDNALQKKSEELWQKYAYAPNENDRVVLTVGLTAKKEGKKIWSESLAIDECGSNKDSAMARLVSLPASFAVEMILNHKSPQGVSAATEDRSEVQNWLKKLKSENLKVFNHDKKNS